MTETTTNDEVVVPEDQLEETADTTDELDEPQDEGTDGEESDTFPRKVVEDLRRENAKYRERAKDRDRLAERLHVALVAATGRLADPTDLPFDEGHLEDADALNGAIEELLAAKPHLASRKPRGDVGQGVSGSSTSVDLAGMLRAGV